ncbi:MAG: anthranilate phosphoribosyltransferase [Verrucomicrobia bacterium]|nr:anthranilate phosphoribosyltransferase [Verrucomicrobiota bacterium]
MLRDWLQSLTAGKELSAGEISLAVAELADPSVAPETKADFLGALASKGETPGEIAGFASALRNRSLIVPNLDAIRERGILDVCGTGGDQLHTFNISTTVSFVVAGAGVTVAKHGNRAITSKSGAADVLEALGVRVDLQPEEVGLWLERYHFAFLFAPRFHPAFQHIGPARKLCAQRGQRTLFNFLGPLLNPARPTAQLVGVAHPRYCAPLAEVLKNLGVSRAMVISGAVPGQDGEPTRYMDEWSLSGPTTVAETYHERALTAASVELAELALEGLDVSALEGGDRETNAGWVRRVLDGSEAGAKRAAVVVNAGAALFVAGRTRSITEGMELARETIDSGRAIAKLREIVHASSSSS